MHRFGTDTDWMAVAPGSDVRGAVSMAPAGSYLSDSGTTAHVGTLLQRPFDVGSKVKSARLYITAMGSYRASLNGKPVSDAVLTPDFTDYRKRVTYQTYDVTAMVQSGSNMLGVLLGAGWYGSGLTWAGSYPFGTAAPSVMAQMVVETEDGKRTTVVTDSSWRSAESPILNSEIYAGETYDARLADGLAAVDGCCGESGSEGDGYGAGGPAGAYGGAYEAGCGECTAQWRCGVRHGAEYGGVDEVASEWRGGATVHLQYAERLNPDHSVYTENLRSAEANDTYILRGGGSESFEPSFTFHGFRYVEVSGYPGKPELGALEGEVVNSLPDQPSAKLETSSELVNKMWTAGLWGQRGNFVSIPTDCPQRDERLGWMGDAGAFWRTGAYNFDIASFTHKFLNDVDDAQTPAGAFTNVAPDVLERKMVNWRAWVGGCGRDYSVYGLEAVWRPDGD